MPPPGGEKRKMSDFWCKISGLKWRKKQRKGRQSWPVMAAGAWRWNLETIHTHWQDFTMLDSILPGGGTLSLVCLLSIPLHGFIHLHSLNLQLTPHSLPDIRVGTSPISRNTDLTANYSQPDLPFKLFPDVQFRTNSLQFHLVVLLCESRTRNHLRQNQIRR